MRDARAMLSQPYVVEVLDVLSNGPSTLAAMKAHIPARRRALEVALRTLVAHGLVTATGSGSWDNITTGERVYRHTNHGTAVVTALSRLSTWTTLFDGTDADG